MFKEIKFRAWDEKNKSFITNDDEFKEYMIGLDGKFYRMDFYSGITGYENGNLIWNELKDIILMQYTGLKDKNGKEIWEGDVVSISGQGNYEVEDICKDFDMLVNAIVEGDLNEIVGNIYENPELITGVKNV